MRHVKAYGMEDYETARAAEANEARLRALFKLYEQEEGVEKLRFDLKLTRRATKLKFSIYFSANRAPLFRRARRLGRRYSLSTAPLAST